MELRSHIVELLVRFARFAGGSAIADSEVTFWELSCDVGSMEESAAEESGWKVSEDPATNTVAFSKLSEYWSGV